MAILQVGGVVAGGLVVGALVGWLIRDDTVPALPPIATLALRREPDRPVRVPETQAVCREIERGLYEIGFLRSDLSFTPDAGRRPFRFDGVWLSGPPIWTLEEQSRGLRPGASATASLPLR